jgi:hypothetical protein
MNRQKTQRVMIGRTGHVGRVTKSIQSPDRNGLPIFRYYEETAKEREAREDIARRAGQAILGELFNTLIWNLGPIEAKKMFANASKLPSHRRKGTSNTSVEASLLAAFDYEKNISHGEMPSILAIAKKLYEGSPVELGNSAVAIAKHIRRLLRQRALETALSNKVKTILDGSSHRVLKNIGRRGTMKDKKPST